VLLLAPVVVLAFAGCESSQTKSARLATDGAGKAALSKVSAGAANPDVRVGETKVLATDAGTAAVVELRNTGAKAQAAIPVQIDVQDAKGASLFKNDVAGLQPALQQMAYLAAGQDVYWVNDQIVAAQRPKKVVVAVGKPKSPAATAAPRIALEGVKLDHDSTGVYASGIVRNTSKLTQINLPIFGVALKGGKVVAAGRSLIEKLAPEPQKKPTRFRMFFIGDPRGADLRLTVAPTVLQEGSS
jgi:hypothetical protein